jgi:hypothetical protein
VDLTAEIAGIITRAITHATAPIRSDLAGLGARLADLEARALVTDRDHGATRERLAAVEARPPIPGPAGKDGAPGADGFTADDLTATQDPADDRVITLGYRRGEITKAIGVFRFGLPRYCGIYDAARGYEKGDHVTWNGSLWYCHAPTATRPGEGSPDWTLAVKHGRDGRDAPRAETRR